MFSYLNGKMRLSAKQNQPVTWQTENDGKLEVRKLGKLGKDEKMSSKGTPCMGKYSEGGKKHGWGRGLEGTDGKVGTEEMQS